MSDQMIHDANDLQSNQLCIHLIIKIQAMPNLTIN